jgi:D-aminopeptidase
MIRLRDLGVIIGELPPGAHNAITDVPGVLVGHTTLIADAPRVARTGVTMVVPRDGAIWNDNVCAAYHVFNGNGEMTGLPWIDESGMIDAPIGLTNTYQVGVVRDAIVRYAADATEEAILNALCAATTMTGYQGRTSHALPHDLVRDIMRSRR